MTGRPVLVSCTDLIRCDPHVIQAMLADESFWTTLWPQLQLQPLEERAEGVRWKMSGAQRGTAEWYTEGVEQGVLVHCFLRAVPSRPRWLQRRSMNKLASRYRTRVWQVKDHCERQYPLTPTGR